MSALWSCFGIGGPHNISEWHSNSLEDQDLIQSPARKMAPHELLVSASFCMVSVKTLSPQAVISSRSAVLFFLFSFALRHGREIP